MNKDEEFWEYLATFDVIGLTETWVEEKNWDKVRKNLPKGYRWKISFAEREKKRGRAKGGIITGVKFNIKETDTTDLTNNITERRMTIEDETWRIFTIYSNNEIDKIREKLDNIAEANEEENLLIGGDFNARTGEEGMLIRNEVIDKRKSRDKKINKEGRKFLNMVEEHGWNTLNGNIWGDEEGNFTYVGPQGKSVIDYAITNTNAINKIERMKIENRVETDHQPVVVYLKILNTSQNKIKQWKTMEDWSEKGIEQFKNKAEEINLETSKKKEVNEQIMEITEKLKNIIPKKRTKSTKKPRINKWWDQECRTKKKEVRRRLKDWKRNKITGEEYKKLTKEYKILCIRKKTEQEEKMKTEIKAIKNETEIWKFINKEKDIRPEKSEQIDIETWRKHFIKMYKGVEENPNIRNEPVNTERQTHNYEEITETEIINLIRKLKNNKSPGEDQIKNEVWKNCPKKIIKEISTMLNNIWKGGNFPESWKQGIICPVFKKGNKEDPKNYRGITLMNSLYKIYASILTNRLTEEVEEKEIIPDNQAGFRKGRCTLDNIYILKHVIDKEITKDKGKLYVLFADLKAAFDTVNREKLWKIMEKKGISQHLIERVKDIYRETRSRVKVGEEITRQFWTEKGLRQGCPLSPILFNIYLSDLEEILTKWQAGGGMVGNIKIWSLSYADDIVIIAKSAAELKNMMNRLERYFESKELTLSEEKSKVMEFRKGGGKEKKERWLWKDREIEQVTEYTYLGYKFQKNNSDVKHIQERVKKARGILGQVWGIGQRIFKNNFRRQMFMFDTLIKSVMLYGVEIWGWKEWIQIERMQERFMRWSLSLEKDTPSYIILEEFKRDKIRIETGGRALKYEKRIELTSNKILQECAREREKYTESKWNIEKKNYLERNGYSWEEIKRRKERGENIINLLAQRDKDIQKQEQWNKIDNSRYNKKYKQIAILGTPRYISTNHKHQKLLARYRCGNEERANKFWLEDRERLCRLCGNFPEDIEHLRHCEEMRAESQTREELLEDTGGGIEWMRNIQRRRVRVRERDRRLVGG